MIYDIDILLNFSFEFNWLIYWNQIEIFGEEGLAEVGVEVGIVSLHCSWALSTCSSIATCNLEFEVLSWCEFWRIVLLMSPIENDVKLTTMIVTGFFYSSLCQFRMDRLMNQSKGRTSCEVPANTLWITTWKNCISIW